MDNPYAMDRAMTPVAAHPAAVRSAFLSRTYAHLAGALIGFTLIEIALFKTGIADRIAEFAFGTSWLLILGGFMIVGWFGSKVAHQSLSIGAQYAALVAVVVAEALFFVPLLFLANAQAPGAITSAAIVSLGGFAGLTLIVMVTKTDFSFLGIFLRWGGIMAIVAIVAGYFMGFHLGLGFSVLMVLFAGGAILFDTSNVLHHYPQDRHVAASLELFTSVAMLFWYVLRIFMNRD